MYQGNRRICDFFHDRWRRNITDVSTWLFRSAGNENCKQKSDIQNSTAVNETNREEIPKLPVPELQHTLSRYLEALQPILSEDKFAHSDNVVLQFGSKNGIGEQLQEILKKRREIYENWAYDWWLDDMYLKNAAALPINSNPGMVFPLRNISSPLEMAKFAARIVNSALAYKEMIDEHELPTEYVTSNGLRQPLCMAQYHRIFTSYRVPGIPKDDLIKSETEFTKARPHFIVACRNLFYVIHLTEGKNAEPISENEIASQLAYILKENVGKQEDAILPVGIMTGLNRDSWADLREQLMQDSGNQRNLSLIEKCILVICFDLNELPTQFNSKFTYSNGSYKTSTRDETNMAHQMLHGGGSKVNSGNRWFDKTIQLIIGSDGVNGLCYEHSPAEGVAVINAIEAILNTCNNLENITIYSELKIIPEKLSWYISNDIRKQISVAKEVFDRAVTDLDFNVFRFSGYGKNFIKSCQCSPDAFIQLALQLTYYKLYGRLCATYESASTRRFRLGRVDCIRAATMEALDWVSSMENNQIRNFNCLKGTQTANLKSTVSMEKKVELFKNAIIKQTEIITENISGHGIDVHLLGLRQAAKDNMIYTGLFEDEAYTTANHFSLSTSQVATKTNSFMGYGPVVPNGYGASYNPKEDSVIFCISSFYSNETTDTKKFTEYLKDSLNLMKDLLAYK